MNRTTSVLKRVAVALATFVPVVAASSVANAATMYVPDVKAELASYKIITIPIPEDVVLECGGFECLPDKSIMVATRRGDIYKVENAYADPPTDVKFTKWATGLNEVLGLAYNPKDGFLYACQRGEITKLKDADKDGVCDVYETFCDGWSISGDYHEYAFMSPFDKDGNLYCVLCLTGSFTSKVPWRGWAMKVTPDGKMHPYASGIRSPAGIDFDNKGNLYYTDNQGPWNGTSSLKLLKPKSFQGHPGGWAWYDLPAAKAEVGPKPTMPVDNSRIWVEMGKIPELVPPPIWLPHERLGQSSSGIACDVSKGKFGPYAGQIFVGDQHHSNLARCSIETVDGRAQGVTIPFKYGFGSGVVPVKQAPDGSMWVGGTNRGWGSVGPKQFALERLVWTGKTAFEIFDVKVKPEGFEVSFTEPVDAKLAADLATWKIDSFSYLYRAEYGSPEVDQAKQTVRAAKVSADGKTVRLAVEGLKVGSVHEIKADALKSAKGESLLHPLAWYTLWAIPKAEQASR